MRLNSPKTMLICHKHEQDPEDDGGHRTGVGVEGGPVESQDESEDDRKNEVGGRSRQRPTMPSPVAGS